MLEGGGYHGHERRHRGERQERHREARLPLDGGGGQSGGIGGGASLLIEGQHTSLLTAVVLCIACTSTWYSKQNHGYHGCGVSMFTGLIVYIKVVVVQTNKKQLSIDIRAQRDTCIPQTQKQRSRFKSNVAP